LASSGIDIVGGRNSAAYDATTGATYSSQPLGYYTGYHDGTSIQYVVSYRIRNALFIEEEGSTSAPYLKAITPITWTPSDQMDHFYITYSSSSDSSASVGVSPKFEFDVSKLTLNTADSHVDASGSFGTINVDVEIKSNEELTDSGSTVLLTKSEVANIFTLDPGFPSSWPHLTYEVSEEWVGAATAEPAPFYFDDSQGLVRSIQQSFAADVRQTVYKLSLKHGSTRFDKNVYLAP
jgi:hypothetical protein